MSFCHNRLKKYGVTAFPRYHQSSFVRDSFAEVRRPFKPSYRAPDSRYVGNRRPGTACSQMKRPQTVRVERTRPSTSASHLKRPARAGFDPKRPATAGVEDAGDRIAGVGDISVLYDLSRPLEDPGINDHVSAALRERSNTPPENCFQSEAFATTDNSFFTAKGNPSFFMAKNRSFTARENSFLSRKSRGDHGECDSQIYRSIEKMHVFGEGDGHASYRERERILSQKRPQSAVVQATSTSLDGDPFMYGSQKERPQTANATYSPGSRAGRTSRLGTDNGRTSRGSTAKMNGKPRRIRTVSSTSVLDDDPTEDNITTQCLTKKCIAMKWQYLDPDDRPKNVKMNKTAPAGEHFFDVSTQRPTGSKEIANKRPVSAGCYVSRCNLRTVKPSDSIHHFSNSGIFDVKRPSSSRPTSSRPVASRPVSSRPVSNRPLSGKSRPSMSTRPGGYPRRAVSVDVTRKLLHFLPSTRPHTSGGSHTSRASLLGGICSPLKSTVSPTKYHNDLSNSFKIWFLDFKLGNNLEEDERDIIKRDERGMVKQNGMGKDRKKDHSDKSGTENDQEKIRTANDGQDFTKNEMNDTNRKDSMNETHRMDCAPDFTNEYINRTDFTNKYINRREIIGADYKLLPKDIEREFRRLQFEAKKPAPPPQLDKNVVEEDDLKEADLKIEGEKIQRDIEKNQPEIGKKSRKGASNKGETVSSDASKKAKYPVGIRFDQKQSIAQKVTKHHEGFSQIKNPSFLRYSHSMKAREEKPTIENVVDANALEAYRKKEHERTRTNRAFRSNEVCNLDRIFRANELLKQGMQGTARERNGEGPFTEPFGEGETGPPKDTKSTAKIVVTIQPVGMKEASDTSSGFGDV